MFIFDISQPNGKVNRFHLGKGIFQIGKDSACRIVVEDPLVSRAHAELRIDEVSVTVVDLNSTNGTWFEEKALEKPHKLKVGDELIIGTATRMIVREIPTKLDSMFFSIGGSGAGSEYFSEESIFDETDVVKAVQTGSSRVRQFDSSDDYEDNESEMGLDLSDSDDFDTENDPVEEPRTSRKRQRRASKKNGSVPASQDDSYSSRRNAYYKDDSSPFVGDAPFVQSSIYEDDFSPFASPSSDVAPASYGASSNRGSSSSSYGSEPSPVNDDYSSDLTEKRPQESHSAIEKVAPAQVPEMAATQEVLKTLVNLLDQPRVQWVLVSGTDGVRMVERGGTMHTVRVFSRHVSAESVLKGVGLSTSLRVPLNHEVAGGVSLSAIPVGTEDWSIVIKRDVTRSRLTSFDSMISKGMMSVGLADFLGQCVQVNSNIVISSSSLTLGLELLEAAKKKSGAQTVIAAFENETKTQGVQVGAAQGYVFAQDLLSDPDGAKAVLSHLNHLSVSLITADDLLQVDLVSILNFASGHKAGCIGCVEAASPVLGLARLAHSQGMENLGVLSMMMTSSCDLWIHLDVNAEGSGFVSAVYDLSLGSDQMLHFAPVIYASDIKGELAWVASGKIPAVIDTMVSAGVHWSPEWFKEHKTLE